MPGRNYSSLSYRYGFNDQEKDDEILGTNDCYDYGDRLYDPQLAKWFSIDPYFQEYPSISPYAFALNNPILLLDKGGSRVIGSDGKPVTYVKDKTTGEITWSANATEDIKKIGNAMLSAPEGEMAFSLLQHMKAKVHLVYDTQTKDGLYGLTETKRGLFKKSSTITLYDLVITDPEAHQGANGEAPALDKTETIGSVGTHEAWHAIMDHLLGRKAKRELRKLLGVSKKDFYGDEKGQLDQFLPRLAERQFRKEYRAKVLDGKADPTDWEKFYKDRGFNIERLIEAIRKKTETKTDEKKGGTN